MEKRFIIAFALFLISWFAVSMIAAQATKQEDAQPFTYSNLQIVHQDKLSTEALDTHEGVLVDPDTRSVENSIIKLRWDLQNPEFVREFVFKPLDPDLNLVSYWTGTGQLDDEFTGNSWSITDPQSGGIVVVGRGQVGTWNVLTDTLGVAVVTIASVGTQGYPVTSTYRIEPNSPVITVQRHFSFSETPLAATVGFRPFIFRASRAVGFNEYIVPLVDGSLLTGNVGSCPFGCSNSDWAGTWIDLWAPSLGNEGVGIALINVNGANPNFWVDYDAYSNSAYVAATPLDGSELIDYDIDLTYQYCVHLGRIEGPENCNIRTPFLELPFHHDPGDTGFEHISAFFDHEYPLQRPELGGSEPQLPGISDTILLFSGTKHPDRWTQPTGFYYSGHDAYDFSLPEQTPVLAAHAGYAVGTQWQCPGSSPINVVTVTQDRYRTVYLHLFADSFWQDLKDNPRNVLTGERIGSVGNSGAPRCSSGPHLHFSVYYDADNDGVFGPNDVVDPFGFDPTKNDPWVVEYGGPTSMWLWKFSPPDQVFFSGISRQVLASGGIRANVPPGATNAPTRLSLMLAPETHYTFSSGIESEPNPSNATPDSIATRQSFWLTGAYEDGTPLIAFTQNVTITVSYKDSDVLFLNENSLCLYQWNSVDNAWIPLDTTVNTASNLVTSIINTPGLFSLRAEPINPAPILSSAYPVIVSNVTATQITLNGANLLPTPRLYLGKVRLNVEYISTTAMNAIIPGGLSSGSYDLLLVNPDGQRTVLQEGLIVGGSLFLPLVTNH